MISASALLVVIAFVTLVIGIFQSGLGLIWVSIASSVLAAVFLGLGVIGTRRPMPTSGVSEGEARPTSAFERAGTLTLEPEPEAAPTRPAVELVRPPMEEEEEAEAPPARRAPAKPRARAAKPAAPSRTAASAAAAAPAEQVVVIPDRDKYHKATCRYAKGEGAMTISKNSARRQGYKRCGVCKP